MNNISGNLLTLMQLFSSIIQSFAIKVLQGMGLGDQMCIYC